MRVADYHYLLLMFIKANTPLRVWGPGGVGKSEVCQQVAKELGMGFTDLRLATQEVGDLIGIPEVVVVTKTLPDGTEDVEHVTSWAKPEWLQEIWNRHHKGQATLLALEEKTRAPKEVTQAAFQLLTERKIHQHALPPDCRLVALDNPPTAEYNTEATDVAENTRWGNIWVDCNTEDWLQGYATDHVSSELTLFIATNKDTLSKPDKSIWDVDSIITRRPRTWALADRIWKAHKDTINLHDPKEVAYMKLALGACVGVASASEFVESILHNWITMEDVVSGKTSFDKVKDDPQQVMRLHYQFLLQLTDKTLNDEKGSLSKPRIQNTAGFLMGLVRSGRKDLAVALLKHWANSPACRKGQISVKISQYGGNEIHSIVAEAAQGAAR